MNKLLEKYLLRGITFAPEDEGKGGGDDGKGGGDGGDDKGGAGGDGKGDEGKGSLGAKPGGLLGTRKPKEGEGEGDGKGGKQEDAKPGADGRPAHIPAKFWNAETKTVKHDEMAKAYGALEKNFGDLKRAKGLGEDVPESEDEYFGGEGLKLEEAQNFGEEVAADDPGLKTWAKIAKKWAIGKDAAIGIAKDMFKGMNEFAPAPVNIEAEREALGSGADELIDGVYLWLDGQERAGKFGAADIDVAVGISHTADGIRFLNKVRSLSGEKPIPMGMPAGHKGLSQEDWHSEMRDAVKAKDYKRQAELDEMGPAIFGSEASTGSPIGGIPNQKDADRHAKK